MSEHTTPREVGQQDGTERRRGTGRSALVIVLVIAVALVAVGSDLLATRISQTPKVRLQTQTALFDTSVDGAAPATKATQPPKAAPTPTPNCQCGPSKTTIQSCTAPKQAGQVIIVCLSKQWLYAYQDGKLVFNTPVETGRPSLPTPTGTFSIFYKNCSDTKWLSNAYSTGQHNAACTEHNGDGYQEMFTSPFPPGSPDWYFPTHINYAMQFQDGGFFLHDAWWHCDFGPGSNVDHYTSGCAGSPYGHIETGSHGCVGMQVEAAAWLYTWSRIGATVIIV